METIERDIAVIMIFSSDGKLLMGQKDPNKGGVYAGNDYWYLPGGGKETNETLEQAFHREAGEETGIDTTGLVLEMVDNEGRGEAEKTLSDGKRVLAKMRFYVFKATLKQMAHEVALKAPTESDMPVLRWFDVGELENTKFTPPARELFRKLGYINRREPCAPSGLE